MKLKSQNLLYSFYKCILFKVIGWKFKVIETKMWNFKGSQWKLITDQGIKIETWSFLQHVLIQFHRISFRVSRSVYFFKVIGWSVKVIEIKMCFRGFSMTIDNWWRIKIETWSFLQHVLITRSLRQYFHKVTTSNSKVTEAKTRKKLKCNN